MYIIGSDGEPYPGFLFYMLMGIPGCSSAHPGTGGCSRVFRLYFLIEKYRNVSEKGVRRGVPALIEK